MAIQYRWERREVECPEEDRVTSVLLAWSAEGEQPVLCGVHCDHPRLKDLDNWECHWACWEQIASTT
jgi:hypothetical protein